MLGIKPAGVLRAGARRFAVATPPCNAPSPVRLTTVARRRDGWRCAAGGLESDPPGGMPRSEFDVDAPPTVIPGTEEDLGPREDDVLPDSLGDSISDAAEATALCISRGNPRAQVELLLPEFWDPISGPIFPNRGDQERFWKMTRRFVEEVATKSGKANVKAVYPDAGVAAMLSHQWQDKTFRIASLNDRRPVAADDELVIVCCPDPPGADDCRRVVSQVSDQDEKDGVEPRPIVLFNQRLASGDVGLGLNARRMRENFLKDFTVTYSLRPIGEVGSVFRKYPGMWKVFVEDSALPGRYKLIAERPGRPQGDALDYLISQALNPEGGAEGGDAGKPADFLQQLQRTVTSMQRFMKSLSN